MLGYDFLQRLNLLLDLSKKSPLHAFICSIKNDWKYSPDAEVHV